MDVMTREHIEAARDRLRCVAGRLALIVSTIRGASTAEEETGPCP